MPPQPPMQLPRSNVLAEADPNSLHELFSRTPAQCTDDTYDRIIHHMRDLRLRLEGTETVRHARVPKGPKALRPRANFSSLFDEDEDES